MSRRAPRRAPVNRPGVLTASFAAALLLAFAAAGAPPAAALRDAAAAAETPSRERASGTELMAETYDVLIRGGRIVDGTGNPWVQADLAIRGDRIAAVGRLEGARARRTIEAAGLVVAPGFIDLLGQSEFTVLVDPHLPSKITQGITTELTGEGGSVAPMTSYTIEEARPALEELGIDIDWRDLDGYARRLKKRGTAINFVHLVGAAQVRMAVLKGENRAPTPDELQAMLRHVERAMEQGAAGLSSSLIYPPGTFADTSELVALARVAARYGGFYATHVRNEADRLLPAIEEAARIGEEAGLPVEIWHLKSAGRRNWGRMPEALAAIEAARRRGIDVTADIYPYPAAATGLAASLPPWASEGGTPALLRRLADPAERDRIRAAIEAPSSPEWENLYANAGGAEGILVSGVHAEENKKYQGKRLSEIAAMRGADPITAMFDLLAAENGAVSAIYFQMSEDDVRAAMAAPYVAFNCDAEGVRPDGILGSTMIHPRSYGTFPRVLGRYVREAGVLTLEDAVRKMTSLPARRLGLRDRGVLRAGSYADVTVFDPATVLDRATFEAPHQYATGIVHVFVNGRPVVDGGAITDNLPGRFLRGPGYKPQR